MTRRPKEPDSEREQRERSELDRDQRRANLSHMALYGETPELRDRARRELAAMVRGEVCDG
jgi:hypothetical protein